MRNDFTVMQNSAQALPLDLERLQAFEQQLDPVRLTAGEFTVRVLGSGRLLAALEVEGLPGIVLKRLPPFPSAAARALYQRAVEAYRVVLHDQMNLRVVEQRCVPLTGRSGTPVLYIVQARQAPVSLGPSVLERATDEAAAAIFRTLLSNVARVWNRNEIDGPDSLTGLDARLGNWALRLEDGLVSEIRYLDTSTPFIRRIGRELLDTSIFLNPLPTPFARLLGGPLQHRMDQYYDLRLVLIDFIAHLSREGQAARIPLALEVVNAFLHTDEAADFYLDPITPAEVDRHRRRNRSFWALFHTLSRTNRFVTARLFRRRYPFVLPRS